MAGLPRHSAWLACAALAFTACARLVGPSRAVEAAPQNLRLGELCTQPADCKSGVCSQAVCCDRACDGVESCDLPGTRGVCTARTLGKPCEDTSQCLEGTCNPDDHVCCATLCEGNCVTCKGAQPGTCTTVPDNEDPRNRCGNADAGVCSACVGGVCLPTAPGTDPHDACPDGTACGVTGVCGTQGGGSCSQDADCAVGRCVAGLCLRVTLEDVLSARFSEKSQLLRMVGFDVDASGNAHALVHQRWPDSPNSTRLNSRMYLIHRNGGAWNGSVLVSRDLCENEGYIPEGAIVHVGHQTLVALLEAPDHFDQHCGPFQDLLPPGRLVMRWLEADGTLRSQVPAPTSPSTEARAGYWVRAAYNGANTVFVAYNATTSDGSIIFLARFQLDQGAFSGVPEVLANASLAAPGDLVLVRGQPVVVTTGNTSSELLAAWVDDAGAHTQPSVLTGCSITRVAAATHVDGTVHYAADCSAGVAPRGADPRVGTIQIAPGGQAIFTPATLSRSFRATSAAPLLLEGSMGYLLAETFAPMRLLLGAPPGTLAQDLGPAVHDFENPVTVVRGRSGRLAFAAWTVDLTRGTETSDNRYVESSRIFWVSLAP